MILLFNLRNVGHFTVYCHNLIRWALLREMKVLYCGLDIESTNLHSYASKFPEVQFLDAGLYLDIEVDDLSDSEVTSQLYRREGIERQIHALQKLQRDFFPKVTVLIQADEFFFNYPLECVENPLFGLPTYAILTFGHRNHYTGHDEKYTWRLRKILNKGSIFTRLLTIDEYHAAFKDPDQSFLVYLPDLYREPCQENVSQVKQQDLDADALERFLNADNRPVLPVAGKFDERKNNLWLLEEVVARPELCCVVIGERIPSSTQDHKIDAILSRLQLEGRLFCRFGFVSHTLFDILFSCPRVKFVALPYLAHYGSSGIHLMAVAHGKPCLVPDVGLMAMRTQNAGLGLLFRHGNREDFRRQFSRLQDEKIHSLPRNFLRFSSVFQQDRLFSTLDYTFGLTRTPPALPPWVQPNGGDNYEELSINFLHKAMSFSFSGPVEKGLELLMMALEKAPNNASLLFKRFLLLLRKGDANDCLDAWQSAMAAGDITCEAHFFLKSIIEYLRDIPAGKGIYDEDMLLTILLNITQIPDQLQVVGDKLASRERFVEAEQAFVRALDGDPERDDIRLNLSDVRRYAGRFAESHAILDELSTRSPNPQGLWCKRGQVFAEEGRTEEAQYALSLEIASGGPFVELAQLWLNKIVQEPGQQELCDKSNQENG